MILKHRDRELLRFEWTGARGVRVLSVNEAERQFLPNHTHNLHLERLRKIESFLQKRVLGIVEFGEKADDLLKVTPTSGTINQDHGTDSLTCAILENIRADSYITQEELCDILSVTRSVLVKAMSRLQLSGQLVRVGSRKTGYWQVNDRTGGCI